MSTVSGARITKKRHNGAEYSHGHHRIFLGGQIRGPGDKIPQVGPGMESRCCLGAKSPEAYDKLSK